MMLYDGFHKIEMIESTLKGKKVSREKLHMKSAVAVIIMDEDDRIALVKQFRPCAEETLWELPAGMIDKEGLSDVETAIEEIVEECGVSKRSIVIDKNPCQKFFVACASTNATTSIYRARLANIGKDKSVDDNDVDEVRWFTINEFRAMCETGIIMDAKTLVAYGIILSECSMEAVM